jgi:hypothetical protein
LQIYKGEEEGGVENMEGSGGDEKRIIGSN